MDKDFIAEVMSERTRGNPKFPGLVALPGADDGEERRSKRRPS